MLIEDKAIIEMKVKKRLIEENEGQLLRYFKATVY
tara:strand:- start:823 stop:927 length:105 start_codon:yes stop_codon:yes gene_type:complete